LIKRIPKIEFAYEYASVKPLSYNPLEATTRVTLLGDAVNAMTSHVGLDVNTAFMDSIDLANALKRDMDWRKELSDYEEKMMKRGFAAVKGSYGSTMLLHASGYKSWLCHGIFYVSFLQKFLRF
jgi:2-polyprenyl-6-methoxyphenol hydroxylase-like FAD-dependent oxidoreductase